MMTKIKVHCKKHPSYQVKRKPKCDCKDCHEMWNRRNIN